MADARLHRSYSIASILVGVAIVGAIFEVYWLDGLFGLGVSLLIAYTGIEQGLSAGNRLVGCSPSERLVASITEEAAVVDGVAGVHDINVHDYGNRRAISLHVEVQSELGLNDAHLIADEVERRIAAKMNAETVVHVDPRPGSD